MSQLTIVSTANTSTVTPGGVVVYTTTLTNAGQTPYTGISVSFGGTPGDATSNGDQTASSGTLSVGTTGAVWTGDIPVGGTVTLTGSVTVDDPYTGGPVMALLLVSAAPGSNCPAGSTDPRCAPAVDVLIPGLSITQSANTAAAVPGQVIGYTLTITNTGTAPYAGAVVTDSFAEMFDDAAYGGNAFANAGAVSYASPVLTWTGDLAPAASAVITFTVTVNNPDTGDKLVITTAASAAAGSSCPPGTTSGGCQLTVAVLTPALTIVKTASTTTPVPGQQVTYTITVTDTGQTSYTGASLTDPLAGVLDDATYDSDAPAAATAGTVFLRRLDRVLDRGPEPGGHRDHHLFGDHRQPRQRGPGPGQHRHLGDGGQQLRGHLHRPAVHHDRDRGQRGHPDHHRDRRRRLGGGRRGGAPTRSPSRTPG